MENGNENGLSAADQQLADKMAAEASSGLSGPSKDVSDAMDKLPQDEQGRIVEAAMEESLDSEGSDNDSDDDALDSLGDI